MTNPNLGVPVGPDPRPSHKSREFDHLPKLHELLPNGGWPGIVYAAVCIHNMANAAERTERPAYLRPIRGADYFYIVGPKGRSQMALVGCGERIPGAAPESGARLFFVDGEVARMTGHEVKFPIWFRPEPEEVIRGKDESSAQATGARPGQSPQGHERVQGGNVAQRQQPRPGGEKP